MTTLVIPEHNDSDAELAAGWLASVDRGFELLDTALVDGRCPVCPTAIAGVWV